MMMYKSTRKASIIKGFMSFVLLSVLSLPVTAANYELNIIQPQPDLDTKNRFYKAYPGLVYNVRLAVVGGEFPYSYALTTAPPGMTIDDKGEITWPDPPASDTPYTITAQVTDSQTTTQNVTWNITVTTSGFRFIDAVNGTSAEQGGTGSISNPWKSMRDMYEGDDYTSKSARSYSGEFLYWRTGTYTMDAFKENTSPRVPLVGNYKPQVWLAYPAEKPVIDMAGAYLNIYSGGSNTYFDGLTFDINGNERGMGIRINSSASNVTFRRNTLFGITNGESGGNHSLIMISDSGPGKNYSIQDNEMYDVRSSGYGLLGYTAQDVLVENNTCHNIQSHPISPKLGTTRWFIRGNRFYNNPYNSIVVQYSVFSGDIEILYNLVESGGGRVWLNHRRATTGSPVYVYRNTFMDEARQYRTTSTNGIFHWSENVIVNETSYPDKIYSRDIEDPSRFIVTNNLTGNAADNIVDSQGYLTQDYNVYIGSRGHQIDKRISAPTGLVVTP